MLHVGLTGGLGSGKSTVAQLFREWGAELSEADQVGREVMEPGQSAFEGIVRHFGPEVVQTNGHLDRARLAHLAFAEGKLDELNAIVHPAVMAAQLDWAKAVAQRSPNAVAIIESAIIFEVERDAIARNDRLSVFADWRRRIDRVVVVTAPVEQRLERYLNRVCPGEQGREAALADARNRIALQIPDEDKARRADFVLDNSGDLDHLRQQAQELWKLLVKRATMFSARGL